MFEQDYLMRMIMQVSHFIARITRLRQEQRPQHALILLGQGYERFFGLTINQIEQMSVSEIKQFLSDYGKDHYDTLHILFEFLSLHRQLLEEIIESEQDREQAIVSLECKRVDLYLNYVVEEERHSLLEFENEIYESLEWLLHYHLSDSLYLRYIEYFMLTNRYARAEDVLYLWKEDASELDETNRQTLHNTARQFYERLFRLDDEMLEQGGLPRLEVQLGYENWLTN